MSATGDAVHSARSASPLLVALGVALVAVSVAGLAVPGSIIEYPRAIATDEPVTVIYPGASGQAVLVLILGLLSVLFLAAVYVSGGLRGRRLERPVWAITVALAAVYILVYPGGSRDIFKNISDTRTLWVYGDNPLSVSPGRHPGDPLLESITRQPLRRSPGYYGPAFYVIAGPAALAGGDSVVANMVTFKMLNALGFLAMVWLAGASAARLVPERRLQAMALVGWNPLLLYEGIGNAHNDLFMGAFMLLACYLALRSALGSLAAWALSAGVKYATALVAPLFLLWHFRNNDKRLVAAFTLVGFASAVATFALRSRSFDTLGIFVEYPLLRTPYAVLFQVLEPRIGDTAYEVGRYVCLGALGLVTVWLLLKSDQRLVSLFGACFWLIAASTALANSYFFPWYMLWFLPLGAALAGRLEARVAVLMSVTGLMSYAIFPYEAKDPNLNYLMVALYFVLPLLYMVAEWKPQADAPREA